MGIDTSNFNFQGIGTVNSVEILGCTDPTALNYNPFATIDDGSCDYLDPERLTYVPDYNFRARLQSLGYATNWYDAQGVITSGIRGEYCLTSDINFRTSLNVADTNNIADLTGIEDFTALEILYCEGQLLTRLNLSNNTALTYLECYQNQLTSLIVSANVNYIDCHLNQLTNLDVSANIVLNSLICWSNQLTSLDVSNNTALIYLDCYDNQLIKLDLSNNTALQTLQCYNNQLTSLDVSANTALTRLYCFDNQLTSLDVRNGNNANIINFQFRAYRNPDLNCISVDNVAYCRANWTNIDSWASFSLDCDDDGPRPDDVGPPFDGGY